MASAGPGGEGTWGGRFGCFRAAQPDRRGNLGEKPQAARAGHVEQPSSVREQMKREGIDTGHGLHREKRRAGSHSTLHSHLRFGASTPKKNPK